MISGRRREALVAALVAVAAFLPFLRGTLSGASLYFRDLALYFFPLRRLALDGLRAGELRFWNPYLHEGVPLSLPALGYPLDLVQLLRPDEAGISLVLALHVPLAALGLYALARRHLEVPPAGATAGALVYALGGFVLSSVNLYVFVQAAAWAPFVVLALADLMAAPGRRGVAVAAVVTAVALSTTGVEIVAQSVLIGLVLGVRRGARPTGRALAAAAVALGLAAALAAPVLLLVASQVGASARSQGFATDVVLAHSIHPFTLVQTIVGGLYGNPSNLADEWWGQNFFPRGFPYILSLYVGAVALALALVGAGSRHPRRGRLVALAVAALVVSLGRWGGLSTVIETVPGLSAFRYPVKAFFTVHLALALLVSSGLGRLLEGEDRRGWTRLALVAGTLGGLLVVVPLLPTLAPGPMGRFAAAFFPPGLTPPTRGALLSGVLADAAIGGALGLAVAAIAVLASRGSLSPSRSAVAIVLLLATDLLRTGAGLNPMVTGSFFRPSPELAAALPTLRESRVFTCSFDDSPAYRAARAAKGAHHEAWTFAVALETLTPAFNVPLGVPTALSPDLTMLVPEDRLLAPDAASCRRLDTLLPQLRRAGVQTIVSTDPLAHPELRPLGRTEPERLAPLALHWYALAAPLPRVQVTETIPATTSGGDGGRPLGGVVAPVDEVRVANDWMEITAHPSEAAVLVVRDGWAPGWTARVDGEPATVERADGRHRAVALPAGPSVVRLRYRPPGWRLGLVSGLLGLVACVALSWRRSLPTPVPGPGHQGEPSAS